MSSALCSVGRLSVVVFGVWVAGPSPAVGTGQQQSLPPFAEVEKAVRQHFAARPGYEEGGIIARSDVVELFGRLQQLGWEVASSDEILDQVPKDGEFLVTQLRTQAGAKFARQIARLPGGFDRLEKLSRLPNGQQTIRDLIKGPDGYKLIQYMTTAPGGAELGRMLSKTPKGRRFNRPTGRIYTVEMLLERLGQEHQAAVQTAASPDKP